MSELLEPSKIIEAEKERGGTRYVFVGYKVYNSAHELKAQSAYLTKTNDVKRLSYELARQNKEQVGESQMPASAIDKDFSYVVKRIERVYTCPQSAVSHFFKLSKKEPPFLNSAEMAEELKERGWHCPEGCSHME